MRNRRAIILCSIGVIAAFTLWLSHTLVAQTRPAESSIAVTVIDAATHRPIPDAKIFYGYDYVTKDLKADKQGQAAVTIAAGHRLHFWARVSAPDHVGQIVSWHALESDTGVALAPLAVALEPGHTLGGDIVDVDGHPVADAFVHFRAAEVQGAASQTFYESGVTTDKVGHWSANCFPADASKLSFTVVHRAYAELASDPQPIDQALRDQKAVLVVHFPLSIEFTVTDAQTGQLIKDRKAFRVAAITTPETTKDANSFGIGTGNGDFNMRFASSAAQAAIQIAADGYETVTSPQITRDQQRKPLGFNAVLKRVKNDDK